MGSWSGGTASGAEGMDIFSPCCVGSFTGMPVVVMVCKPARDICPLTKRRSPCFLIAPRSLFNADLGLRSKGVAGVLATRACSGTVPGVSLSMWGSVDSTGCNDCEVRGVSLAGRDEVPAVAFWVLSSAREATECALVMDFMLLIFHIVAVAETGNVFLHWGR